MKNNQVLLAKLSQALQQERPSTTMHSIDSSTEDSKSDDISRIDYQLSRRTQQNTTQANSNFPLPRQIKSIKQLNNHS